MVYVLCGNIIRCLDGRWCVHIQREIRVRGREHVVGSGDMIFISMMCEFEERGVLSRSTR